MLDAPGSRLADRRNRASAGPKPVSYARLAGIGGLLVAIGPISLSLYTPALPVIAAAFGSTPAALKLSLTAYFAGFAGAQLVCGPMSDAFGRKPVLLSFIGLYILASGACALAPSVAILIAARLAQGIGATAGLAIVRAMVRDRFSGQTSAQLYNLIALVLAIGPALSPSLGAAVLALANWHGIFLLMLGYGLVMASLAAFLLPETLDDPDPASVRPRRIARTMGRLLASRDFMGPALMIGMIYGGIYALMPIMPFIVIKTMGLSEFGFAAVMLAQTGSYILANVAVRHLLKHMGAEPLMRAGIALAVAGVLLFAIGPRLFAVPPVALIVALLATWATSVALINPGATALALAPFPQVAGAASALLGFFQMGGGFAGSGVAAAFPDPVTAMATVIPIMGILGTLSMLILVRDRRL